MNSLPICVDLDGTLIRDEVTFVALKKYLKESPSHIFCVVLWLLRGRAYYKSKLAQYIDIDPAELRYNINFINYLRDQKIQGRRIILVTGASVFYANKIANHLKIFDEVFATEDRVNLIAKTKAVKLSQKFGGDFIYAGNSNQDIPVWKICKKAILVKPTILARIRMLKMKSKICRLFD